MQRGLYFIDPVGLVAHGADPCLAITEPRAEYLSRERQQKGGRIHMMDDCVFQGLAGMQPLHLALLSRSNCACAICSKHAQNCGKARAEMVRSLVRLKKVDPAAEFNGRTPLAMAWDVAREAHQARLSSWIDELPEEWDFHSLRDALREGAAFLEEYAPVNAILGGLMARCVKRRLVWACCWQRAQLMPEKRLSSFATGLKGLPQALLQQVVTEALPGPRAVGEWLEHPGRSRSHFI